MADETRTPQGTPGEGRFYLPPSETPKDDSPAPAGTPEGRFYLPSGQSSTTTDVVGDPSAQTVQEEPVAAASVLAGDPPSKTEIRDAKADQKAAEQSGAPTGDPAAQTVHEEPVAAASALAGDPPLAEPKGNASRDDWEAYARSKGATDADLVDTDGNPVSRDQLRERYGTPSE